jgi:hypothetical protein
MPAERPNEVKRNTDPFPFVLILREVPGLAHLCSASSCRITPTHVVELMADGREELLVHQLPTCIGHGHLMVDAPQRWTLHQRFDAPNHVTFDQ